MVMKVVVRYMMGGSRAQRHLFIHFDTWIHAPTPTRETLLQLLLPHTAKIDFIIAVTMRNKDLAPMPTLACQQ